MRSSPDYSLPDFSACRLRRTARRNQLRRCRSGYCESPARLGDCCRRPPALVPRSAAARIRSPAATAHPAETRAASRAWRVPTAGFARDVERAMIHPWARLAGRTDLLRVQDEVHTASHECGLAAEGVAMMLLRPTSQA